MDGWISQFHESLQQIFWNEEQLIAGTLAFQIEALAGGWLVEIEMVLAKPK